MQSQNAKEKRNAPTVFRRPVQAFLLAATVPYFNVVVLESDFLSVNGFIMGIMETHSQFRLGKNIFILEKVGS